ncbi:MULTISPECIES: type II toxin-antitoxin system ParD family antitoxin [Alphaproteobacteria]|uniref:type II toxin-antitoxin system ParD family antitoxin n=1 Tax=Alphaproteobacteria TaxID=28211 RepID=UPI003297A533
MRITLPPDLEAMIQEKIEAGLFNSADEVIAAALTLMMELDDAQREKLARLRAAVQVGIDQADRGDFAEDFSIEKLQSEMDEGTR